ncbi:MAG: PD-(D/E)XK nuclease family protein [Candidatus Obscuribacterales bacterium]|nr:PD-(D/E)XK nuclease family protein [Candidatus Obscuribacterales bacterium]
MKLDIIFGWHLDGPSYPEVSAVGRLTVGPIGLISQLCLRLGIAVILPAYSVRIAEYMSMMSQLDDGNRFYSRSFETDRWGAAKMLLQMRDELVGSGWLIEHDNPSVVDSMPKRLATFEELERLRNKNILSTHDLVNPILRRLNEVQNVAIDKITLIDDLEELPPIWRKLILLLEKKGVDIEVSIDRDSQISGSAAQPQSAVSHEKVAEKNLGSDVERLRSSVLFQHAVELTGDSTFAILESDDEVQAADYIGRLLSTIDDSDSTVIIRGSSTAILDHFLKKQSLPSLGGGSTSQLRGYLQALPLALELLWAPFDPARMIEFLMVPMGPIPRYIARRFIQALRNQPGIGGGAWQSAWDETREDLLTRLNRESELSAEIEAFENVLTEAPVKPAEGAVVEDFGRAAKKGAVSPVVDIDIAELGDSLKETVVRSEGRVELDALVRSEGSVEAIPLVKSEEVGEADSLVNLDGFPSLEALVESRMQTLRDWLEPPLFDTGDGVPAKVLLSICDRFRKHATMRLNTMPDSSGDQLQVFAKMASCAEVLSATITSTGAEKLVRSQLLKIVESAIGDGYSPDEAEASSWVPIDHPGQLLSSAHTVIWWGFIEQQMKVTMDPWTKEELVYLAHQDVVLEPSQKAVIREAKSWRRPLLVSPQRLILVKPRTVAGRAAAAHPFFHEISAALEGADPGVRNRIIKQAHECYFEPKTEILNHVLVGQPVVRRRLPGPRPQWRYREDLVVPKHQTATSLERLLACPMSWLLKFQANLKYGNLLSVVSGEQLAGVLAHAVFAEIFSTDVWTTTVDTKARAEAEFDRLCPRLAAPLLQPGFSLERQRLKKAICDGAGQLSDLIREAGFSSITCESVRTAVFDDIEITGRPDMVLKHPDHFDYVIDLKWSRSTIYRRREILEGRAIQLAVYSTLERLESKAKTDAGYFLIGQRQLLSASEQHPFPSHSYVNGEPLDLTFDRMIANARTHLDYLRGGIAYATGFAPEVVIPYEEVGVTIISDDEPELRSSNIPDITLTLEPPCRICEFGRLCGKKEYDA